MSSGTMGLPHFPLPVQLVDAASDLPVIKSIFNDFQPRLDYRTPRPADKITITILGTELDQIGVNTPRCL